MLFRGVRVRHAIPNMSVVILGLCCVALKNKSCEVRPFKSLW